MGGEFCVSSNTGLCLTIYLVRVALLGLLSALSWDILRLDIYEFFASIRNTQKAFVARLEPTKDLFWVLEPD